MARDQPPTSQDHAEADSQTPGQTDGQPLEGGAGVPLDQATETAPAETQDSRIDRSEVDPAQRSLADALKVSFNLLKVAMVLLIVAYIASGLFRVPTQKKVVRLVFGEIAGEGENQVYDQGWHFNFPFPIGEEVQVPMNPQSLSISNAFWFSVDQQQLGMSVDEMSQNGGGPLNPLTDGSLITGNANLVHGKFRISYQIADPVDYVQHVGRLDLAAKIVRNAVKRGLVLAAAQTNANDFISGRFSEAVAERSTQQTLDELRTGLEVVNISAANTTMPLAVLPAYRGVSNAESEKAEKIDDARKEYAQVLSETAGGAYPALLDLVEQYEQASAVLDQQRMDGLEQQINQALGGLQVQTDEGQTISIGGAVAERINQAKTYRNQIVQRLQGEAQRFQALLKQFKASPRILTDRLWQDTREAVFTGDIEKIYTPEGADLRIDTSGDPQLKRQRQMRRLNQTEDQANQPTNNGS